MTEERRSLGERRKCAMHNDMHEDIESVKNKIEELVPSKWFMYIVSGLCATAVIIGSFAYKSVEAKNNEQDADIKHLTEIHEKILKGVETNHAILLQIQGNGQ